MAKNQDGVFDINVERIADAIGINVLFLIGGSLAYQYENEQVKAGMQDITKHPGKRYERSTEIWKDSVIALKSKQRDVREILDTYGDFKG